MWFWSRSKPISREPLDDLVHPRLGHAGDDQVLLAGDPHVAADGLGQVGHRDQLVARGQAEVHRDADVAQALLTLAVDADVVGHPLRPAGQV